MVEEVGEERQLIVTEIVIQRKRDLLVDHVQTIISRGFPILPRKQLLKYNANCEVKGHINRPLAVQCAKKTHRVLCLLTSSKATELAC